MNALALLLTLAVAVACTLLAVATHRAGLGDNDTARMCTTSPRRPFSAVDRPG